jgi:hypothetical protein
MDRCYVDPETDCWCWKQHTTKHGLAMVNLILGGVRKKSLGRRAALLLSGKVAPTKDHVAYPIESCFTPNCVNPKHARWGTRCQRMRQAAGRGSLSSPERIANLLRCVERNAKLTPEQRLEVAMSSEPAALVAQRLGVSAGRVNQLRRCDEKRRAASAFEWRG